MTLMTVVKDLSGKVIGTDTKVPKEIEAFESTVGPKPKSPRTEEI